MNGLQGILFSTIFLLTACQQQGAEHRELGAKVEADSVRWLMANGKAPVDYVVSKFTNYDLVLLGESHEIKENCQFVASLIEPSYQVGVRALCLEFISSKFNDRLAKIVTAKEYDEQAVQDIYRKSPWPTFGNQEYMDIIRAVWMLNRNLPSDAEPFRVVGIEGDFKMAVMLKAKSKQDRFKMNVDRENHIANTIEQEVFGKKTKALVLIGQHHTVRQGGRMADQLAKYHGDKMFQISLHNPVTKELKTFIENVVEGAKQKSVGFDVVNSPMATLRDDNEMVWRMMGAKSSFQNLAQGYVFLKPARELSPVTWVTGFILPETFDDAIIIAEDMFGMEKGKYTTASELDAAMAERLSKRSKKKKSP